MICLAFCGTCIGDAEQVSNGRGDVAKAIESTEIDTLNTLTKHQLGGILSGVVCGLGISGIATVVCGDHQDIVLAKFLQE